jgi:hypothetical protein
MEASIELYYNDIYCGKRHIKVVSTNAKIDDEFSTTKLKIRLEELIKLLEHHLESLKGYEKYAKENKLGDKEFLDVFYKGEHIFIPLEIDLNVQSKEVWTSIEQLKKTIYNDLFQLLRYAKVTLEDVQYKIESEIVALGIGTEFSLNEIFEKYKNYINNSKELKTLKEKILNDNYIKGKIKPIDNNKNLFVRINKYSDPFDNDYFKIEDK